MLSHRDSPVITMFMSWAWTPGPQSGCRNMLAKARRRQYHHAIAFGTSAAALAEVWTANAVVTAGSARCSRGLDDVSRFRITTNADVRA